MMIVGFQNSILSYLSYLHIFTINYVYSSIKILYPNIIIIICTVHYINAANNYLEYPLHLLSINTEDIIVGLNIWTLWIHYDYIHDTMNSWYLNM